MFDKVHSKVADLKNLLALLQICGLLLHKILTLASQHTSFLLAGSIYVFMHALLMSSTQIASKLTSCFEQWNVVNKVHVIVGLTLWLV